ncbi:unnamed protein product [Vitrella brassicaformis CCMP3155]|uniref:Kazal-like domain-containing protein n=1 Tax=Vitrella brassicaformis (strain CCMP3155) TaxID=1169540 RepID=A0A0G4FDT8_VITBC|nr:unnamed protein product [Vitrella brassicaformis CCMP3155]|eukprot:CEM11343.1 unnamed protein product [Vitrella brassicaformis CCMP3155]
MVPFPVLRDRHLAAFVLLKCCIAAAAPFPITSRRWRVKGPPPKASQLCDCQSFTSLPDLQQEENTVAQAAYTRSLADTAEEGQEETLAAESEEDDPVKVATDESPVCGEDGITYASACLCLCQGSQIHGVGSCESDDDEDGVVTVRAEEKLDSPASFKDNTAGDDGDPITDEEDFDGSVAGVVNRYRDDGFVFIGRMEVIKHGKSRQKDAPSDIDSSSGSEEEDLLRPMPLPWANETLIAMKRERDEIKAKQKKPVRFRWVRANPWTGDTYVSREALDMDQLDVYLETHGLDTETEEEDLDDIDDVDDTNDIDDIDIDVVAGDGGLEEEDMAETEEENGLVEKQPSAQRVCVRDKKSALMPDMTGGAGGDVESDEQGEKAQHCRFCCDKESRKKVSKWQLRKKPFKYTAFVGNVGCTAQLISDKVALTAGHCCKSYVGWQDARYCQPGRDKFYGSKGYGKARVISLAVNNDYFRDPSIGKNDFCALELRPRCKKCQAVGKHLGHFNLPKKCSQGCGKGASAKPEKCSLKKGCKNLYPATKCDAYPGQSGSCHVAGNIVRGILSAGDCEYNYSVHIAGSICKQIKKMANELKKTKREEE